jgi:hypothetical protein
MLEAASPRGCRGELVPRGSSETDSVPLAPGDLTSALDDRAPQYPHVRLGLFYCSTRPRPASQLDPTTRGRISRLAFAFLRGWATA